MSFIDKMSLRMIMLALIGGGLLLLVSSLVGEPDLLKMDPRSGCVVQSSTENNITESNIVIVFSSFKNIEVLKLMLDSYQKYSNGAWELYIFTDKKEKDAKEALRKRALPFEKNVVAVDKNMYEHQKFWERNPKLAGIQNIRMMMWRDWFRENKNGLEPHDRVIVTDEDIFFNGNPFGIFEAYPGKSLFFFGETSEFTNKDGWNKEYVEMSTPSKLVREHVFSGQVYCIGVTIGTVYAVHHFLERVVTAYLIRGFPTNELVSSITDNPKMLANKFIDQGVSNIFIHTGLLDDLGLKLISNEQPWVAHLTSQLGRENLVEFALNRTLVHQYKFAPKMKKWIRDTYGSHLY